MFRFGLFEADEAKSTLSRGGTPVKIQEQPFRLLLLLLERPGEIITREELRQRLWPDGTYVDFDGSLDVILKRLRSAIDDQPKNPRFIETLPRRGYRFIAPVTVIQKSSENQTSEIPGASPATDAPALVSSEFNDRTRPLGGNVRRNLYLIYAPSLALVVLALAWVGWHYGSPGKRLSLNSSVRMRKSVAILGFQNLSGRAEDAWLGTALSEMLSTELAGGEKLRLISGEDVANLRNSSPWSLTDTLDRGTTTRIRTALNSDVLVLGSYLSIANGNHGQLRFDVRMQDAKTGEILTEVAEVGSTQDLFRLVSRIGGKLRERLGIEELHGRDEAGVLASLPLDPDVARFYALGVAKLRDFDALAAKDLLQHAADADPKFSLVHSMLARAWAQLGYEQKHREEAKKALDLAADLPRAQRLLVEGEYYESLGKPEDAASAYHALFELFPDNLDYGLRLAHVYSLAGRASQAREVVGQLRKLPSPSSNDPRIDLADERCIKDNKPAALALVQSAESKASERAQKLVYAAARKEECMIMLYGEHPDDARPICEDAYNAFLSAGNRLNAADAVRMMADAYGGTGNFQKAIETYQRALSLLEPLGEHEKTGAILNNMAINYGALGDLDHAERYYRAAKLEFEQAGDLVNRVTTTANVADVLFLRGNLAGAEKLYQEGLRLASSMDSDQAAYIFYRMADLNLTQGRVHDAHRLAQQAVDALLPVHGGYQYLTGAMLSLGEALEAQNDLAGARSQFEQTLTIRQKMGAPDLVAESQVELGNLAIEEGQPEKAESLLRPAISEFEKEKADPNTSSAYTVLSRALLMQGKIDEARVAAQRGSELSLTSSDPALRMPAEIQKARIEMASPDHRAANSTAALHGLQSVIATAKHLGYYNVECQARVALGELELKTNSSLAHKHLSALASEAHSHGLDLVARQAQAASNSGTVVAQNR